MKELTIEEKAQRYDEAIEIINDYYQKTRYSSLSCASNDIEVLEKAFPELKESKNERMIQYFKDLAPFDKADELYEKYGFSHKDALAWLEKQGEHAKFCDSIQVGDKVTRNEDGVLVNLSQLKRVAKNQGEQQPADKVEPKFKVGDWIANNVYNNVVKVLEVNGQYRLDYGNTIGAVGVELIDTDYHLWTIQDAKDGDVLVSKSGDKIFLYRGNLDLRGRPCAHYGIYKVHDGIRFTPCAIGNYFTYEEVYPATKEQRDTLIKAMADAGYAFDFEKKELKKIEQKPAGSEEDGKDD